MIGILNFNTFYPVSTQRWSGRIIYEGQKQSSLAWYDANTFSIICCLRTMSYLDVNLNPAKVDHFSTDAIRIHIYIFSYSKKVVRHISREAILSWSDCCKCSSRAPFQVLRKGFAQHTRKADKLFPPVSLKYRIDKLIEPISRKLRSMLGYTGKNRTLKMTSPQWLHCYSFFFPMR